ncbi:uncharacterized protein MONOS_3470 [Monocercomonoides exilis]|uniref:uncharacterized protein n=1 Tax=Monocercomonoides exilis TaxID=2049356 RepID=UPI00355ABB5C|nr:hypothetical protein MONOS_3470 [Monocercomonoides exilis]|eukprot:MONOS_3470.1-p1 / transcript=MONOS_3470.1 / gene=MONOS_3470 / organism=Monocercomonoides_exilis_PA203 / gene_product=unspecified product / transcript_product=unspecified product / location=Mono_scaffold00082:51768-53606(+) / protein_length=613 / sequence_SO=supercontig / SO=protein_coding / is_pseudo=false
MCNNEKGPVAEKVFGSKNENQPIIGKNFDIQTAETSSISSSISSHSSNTLSSIDSFAQLLKENERGWEPICEINKAQCADANNIEEITKRPEFAEEQKTLLLKKWEEADAKMLNAMGLLKSSDIFISKKLDRNKLERIDDIVKDEDGEKDTNFEQYTKNVEEKAWKRRLSEVNRQLNEAKIFYYLYGEWIRKPWMFDKRELDLWNKTEKKAKWNRQHGQCKFSLATIEEMKSLLKDADKNGITENEQVLIRHQLQKCERITEEDLDNKIVTPFKKYGFIRQKTYNRFIATAGNHSSQRKDEALQEEEQEGEKDPSTSISSLIFDQHSPLLQQEHNKKSTFTQVEFPFVADDTLSSIHSHSISNIDDFSNSLIFHKHQDASSKFPFVSSQMQQPFVSDGFSYHSLLLNPDRTSFYSFLEHPASSAPSLLHKQQLSSDHSCNQNVQHFLEELRDPFRFQAAEDNNTDCSFGINENTSNNEIPIVVSLCWLNYSNGNENDANNQLQREVLQQKERASTKTIKQRLLHLTPPQRKFLWCFDEFIPSLQKQWKKWFQLKGRHYRSMPKKQLAEIFFKYSEPLINDEASSEQKEKIKAMIESTSKNMNIEKEISFTSF